MNILINFDPYTTLDLFHLKQKRSNIKEIETWKVANRLLRKKSIIKLTKRTLHKKNLRH